MLYIYIYIYIYMLSFTDRLFRRITTFQCRLKLGSKPAQLYVRLGTIPLSQQVNHVSSGIIRHYVVAFVCLHFCQTGYQSAQFIRRALHYANGGRKFLRRNAQHPWGNVYIVIHREIVLLDKGSIIDIENYLIILQYLVLH